MPKPNLHHLCFSVMMKRPQPHHHHHHHPTSPPPPLHHHHHNHPPTTTTAALITNYNSLFEDSSASTTTAFFSFPSSSDHHTTMAEEEDEDNGSVGSATPDLTAIYASRRFFISSPGLSNSIVDSLTCSSSSSSNNVGSTSSASEEEVVAGGVPVQTYSPDPYVDFRRSMEEMVEAHREVELLEGKEDAWDYLQQLLLSYLSLNPKSTHKYIVGAFADLVATLFLTPNHSLHHSYLQ